MNFLRRLLILLYGLVLLALISIILLFPDAVADGLRSLGDIDSTTRGAAAVIIGFVILIALFLLIRAPRFNNQDGLIVKTSGALADVGIASARERILKAVRAVPNVVSADVKLQAIQGKADIDLSVEVAGTNVNVPDKQREIDRALRQVTLKQLGLQLASRPRVHIQLMTEEELRARDEAVRRPASPSAALPTEAWIPAPVSPPPPVYVPPPAPVETAPEPLKAEPWDAPPPVVETAYETVEPEPWDAPPSVVETAYETVEPEPWDAPLTAVDAAPEASEPELWDAEPVEEEPDASDFVLTPAPETQQDLPSWLQSEPEDDLLVRNSVDAPDFLNEEALATERQPDADDESLTIPPVDFVVPPAAPADDDLVLDMDASALSDEADGDDWLSVDSSDDEEASLSAEERERRNQNPGMQSPPLPDLD